MRIRDQLDREIVFSENKQEFQSFDHLRFFDTV